jgi:hypothetical protein
MARGRKRKAGQREANGRIQRDPFAGRPAQAHLEAIGVNPKDQSIHCIVEARRVAAGASPRDELASTPLGMMRAINLISAEQYQAGLLYEANQERLGKMLQGQRRTRSELASFLASGSSVYAGIDDDNFKKAYYRCRWVEREIAARVADWRLLDRIVVKQDMPPLAMLADPDNPSPDLVTFRADLSAIGQFYARPPRFDDSRHPNDRSGMIPPRLAAKLSRHAAE